MHQRAIDRKKYPYLEEKRVLKITYSGTFGPPHECEDKTIEIIRSRVGDLYCAYTRKNKDFKQVITNAPIDEEAVHEFKAMLSKIHIPAFSTFDGYGCDGGLTEIEMGNGSTNTHLRWWFTPPGWEELDRVTGYILHTVINEYVKREDDSVFY